MKQPEKTTPIAPHFVELYDGHDRMVRCIDCTRASVPNYQGVGGCIRYVPSMSKQMQHCNRFRRKP